MRNTLSIALLGLLLAAAPLALAQEDNSTRPSQAAGDAAWVEDCPPDMMCAAGGEQTNESSEPTRGPADGSCENCRGDNDTPIQYGPDGCIDCSGPAPSDNGTCMDGMDPGEQCDPDVQYIGGGSPPATDTSHSPVVESDGTDEKTVPAPAVALLIVGIGAAMVLLGRRR